MKRSHIYGITTVVIWSTMAAVVKSILQNIPNFEVLSVSSMFAFLFLLLVNILYGSVKKMREYSSKEYITMSALGFLGLFMYSSLYYYGLSNLTSQEACILNYLWPMALVIFSCIILKEAVTVKKIAAMLMSFAGIIVLTMGSTAANGGNFIIGVICCILAAGCYGLFSVLNKKANFDQNITMMIIWLTTAVCAFAAGHITEEWVVIKGAQWLGIIYLGVVIDAIAYLLWALALKYAENSARIANLAYLTPFLSVMISAIFLKEQVRSTAIIAMVLIVGGILIQSVNKICKPR